MFQMKTRTHALLASLSFTAAGLAGAASGQSIFVEQYVNGSWLPIQGLPFPGSGTGLASGSDISLTLSGSETVRIYTDNPETTDIGLITIDCPPTASPTVLVAGGSVTGINTNAPLGTSAARTVGGVITKGRGRVQIHAGSISGEGIEAHRVARVDLTGDLDAPIIHWGEPGQIGTGIASIIVGGSITENAPVVAVNGRVDNISVSGDVLTSLAAQNGGFERITIGGDLGSILHSAQVYGWAGTASFGISYLLVDGSIGHPIREARVLSGGAVVRIEADEIHAEIDTLLDADKPGFVGGVLAHAGDLTGSLMFRSLTSYGGWIEAPCVVSVAGDVDATVFVENVIRNERPNGPEIDIAGNVTPDSVLSVSSIYQSNLDLPGPEIRIRGEKGLGGLLLVGNENPASFEGNAKITIGTSDPFTVTPDTRFYRSLFEILGGGSAAIAPFSFHELESFPQHNETITLQAGATLTGAVVRLFGPVFGGLPELVIEHRADGQSSWVDRSAEFMPLVASQEIDATQELRVESLGASGFEPGEWRILPVDGTIRCAFVRDTPAVRFESEYDDGSYRFVVASECDQPRGIGQARDGDSPINDTRFEDENENISLPDPGSNPCP